MSELDYLEIIYEQTRTIEDLNKMVNKLTGELEQLKGILNGDCNLIYNIGNSRTGDLYDHTDCCQQ